MADNTITVDGPSGKFTIQYSGPRPSNEDIASAYEAHAATKRGASSGTPSAAPAAPSVPSAGRQVGAGGIGYTMRPAVPLAAVKPVPASALPMIGGAAPMTAGGQGSAESAGGLPASSDMAAIRGQNLDNPEYARFDGGYRPPTAAEAVSDNAFHGFLPSVAGFAAAPFGGLFGGIPGAIAAGTGASTIAQDAQDAVLKAMSPGRYANLQRRLQTEQQQYPYQTAVGNFLPQLALMKPGIPTKAMLPSMALGAGIQSGMEALNEFHATGAVDPKMALFQGALGGLGAAGGTNRFGEAVMAPGEALAARFPASLARTAFNAATGREAPVLPLSPDIAAPTSVQTTASITPGSPEAKTNDSLLSEASDSLSRQASAQPNVNDSSRALKVYDAPPADVKGRIAADGITGASKIGDRLYDPETKTVSTITHFEKDGSAFTVPDTIDAQGNVVQARPGQPEQQGKAPSAPAPSGDTSAIGIQNEQDMSKALQTHFGQDKKTADATAAVHEAFRKASGESESDYYGRYGVTAGESPVESGTSKTQPDATGKSQITHGNKEAKPADGGGTAAAPTAHGDAVPARGQTAEATDTGGHAPGGGQPENGRPSANGQVPHRAESGTQAGAEPASKIEWVRPEDLKVLPGMQYKRAGIVDPKAGVTAQLKNQRVYNVDQGGILTAFRDMEGNLSPVNGHHRTELGQRAERFVSEKIVDGKPQFVDVPRRMQVQVLDAKDGWTPELARFRGAMENLRDGKGEAIDAADALASLGDGEAAAAEVRALPQNALSRDVSGLVHLDDAARMQVRNNEVKSPVAAAIGSVLRGDTERIRVAMEQARTHNTRGYDEGASLAMKVRDEPIVRKGPSDQMGFEGFDEGAAVYQSTAGVQAKIQTAVEAKLNAEKSNLLAVDKTTEREGEKFDVEGRRKDAEQVDSARTRSAVLFEFDPEVKAALRQNAADEMNGRISRDEAIKRVREVLLSKANQTNAETMKRAGKFASENGQMVGSDAGGGLLSQENSGTDSLFQSAAKKQTDTPAFKSWFGDSKIVSPDGSPKPVYHGTKKPFTTFDTARGKQEGSAYGPGSYFTDSPVDADSFSKTGALGGESIIPTYLSLKNPLVMNRPTDAATAARLSDLLGRTIKEGDFIPLMTLENRYGSVSEGAKAAGFDGLIYGMTRSTADGKTGEVEHYVAFEPTQVKSAIGNRGTFDPTDPNILHQPDQEGIDGNPNRAAIEFKPNNRTVLRALSSPDASSGIHEAAHGMRRDLFRIVRDKGSLNGITSEDLAHVERWAGVESGASKWHVEGEEKFARAFEGYLMEGKAPTQVLRKVFSHLKDALMGVYKAVRGTASDPSTVPISPEVRAVFDKMLGGEAKGTGTEDANIATTNNDGPGGSGVRPLVQPGAEDTRVSAESATTAPTTPNTSSIEMDDLEARAEALGIPVKDRAEYARTFADVQKAVDENRVGLYHSLMGKNVDRGDRLTTEEMQAGGDRLKALDDKELPDLLAKVEDATKSGDEPGAIKSRAALNAALDEYGEIHKRLHKEGSERGRALAMQKLLVDKSELNAGRIIASLEKVSRTPLSAEAKETIVRQANKGKLIEKDITENVNARASAAEARLKKNNFATSTPAVKPDRAALIEQIRRAAAGDSGGPDTLNQGGVNISEKTQDAGTGLAGRGDGTDAGGVGKDSQKTDTPDTPAFKAWFKDSKVTDSDGKPLVVYHGTPHGEFNIFETAKESKGAFGNGFYFTPDKSLGEIYSTKPDGTKGFLHETYLSLKKPFNTNTDKVFVNGEAHGFFDDAIQDEDKISLSEITNLIKKQGFDGLYDPTEKVYLAFDPRQIKDAYRNRGTFDASDPNILHQSTAPVSLREAAVALGVHHIENGTKKYAEWAKEMRADMGADASAKLSDAQLQAVYANARVEHAQSNETPGKAPSQFKPQSTVEKLAQRLGMEGAANFLSRLTDDPHTAPDLLERFFSKGSVGLTEAERGTVTQAYADTLAEKAAASQRKPNKSTGPVADLSAMLAETQRAAKATRLNGGKPQGSSPQGTAPSSLPKPAPTPLEMLTANVRQRLRKDGGDAFLKQIGTPLATKLAGGQSLTESEWNTVNAAYEASKPAKAPQTPTQAARAEASRVLNEVRGEYLKEQRRAESLATAPARADKNQTNATNKQLGNMAAGFPAPVPSTKADLVSVGVREYASGAKDLVAFGRAMKKALGPHIDDATLQQAFTEAAQQYKTDYRALDNVKKVLGNTLQSEAYKNLPIAAKLYGGAVNVINAGRSLTTSFDLSAPFRQGSFLTFANPKLAAKSFAPMIKAFGNEEFAQQVDAAIRTRPNAPEYERAGLNLSDADDDVSLTAGEELFRGKLAEKIPGVGHIVRGSERAYTTYLNKLRADTFDTLASTVTGNGSRAMTDEEAKALGNFINVATGRGQGKFSDNFAKVMNGVLFSPRFSISRFQLAGGQPIIAASGSRAAQKVIARTYLQYAGSVATVLGMAQIAKQFGADADVEKDPRSANFGKVRVGGVQIDIHGGMQQVITYTARMLSNESKGQDGKIKTISGLDTTTRLVRGKLAPATGSLADLATRDPQKAPYGKDFIGQSVSGPKNDPWQAVRYYLGKNVAPMTLADFYSAAHDSGIPRASVVALLSGFGFGVRNLDTKEQASLRQSVATPSLYGKPLPGTAGITKALSRSKLRGLLR